MPSKNEPHLSGWTVIAIVGTIVLFLVGFVFVFAASTSEPCDKHKQEHHNH